MMTKLLIDRILHPSAKKAGVQLYMARADLIHPLASGNKVYKLMPNLEFAKLQGYKQLLSFGGAFSNHIHALALMAQKEGFESVGVIRGEQAYASNPTLKMAQSAGMQLEFVDRITYKRRHDVDYLVQLQQQYPNALIIPEGGSSQLAIQGCASLVSDINQQQDQKADVLTIACGTGATLSGLICGLKQGQTAIGYAVLKDGSLKARVADYIKSEKPNDQTVICIEKADFGGYAKLDSSLLDFILAWLDNTGILLDPIYTSKMCMRLMQQIESGEFKSGSTITMIHSGGLQGWYGMEKQVNKLSNETTWALIYSKLTC